MATTTFERGDIFQSLGGVGVALDGSKAVIVTGEGGRTGYSVRKMNIPEDAVPISARELHNELQMVFQGAIAATEE